MLRRSLISRIPMRGGGHEHPDFPHVGVYKHKRIISIFETNMWVYDGLQPEYIVDIHYPGISFGTQVTYLLFFGGLFPLVVGFLISEYKARYFGMPFRETKVRNENDNVRRMLARFREEKPFNMPHPLGHMHTYKDEGWTNNSTHWIYNRYRL